MNKKSVKELISDFENASDNTDTCLQPKKGRIIDCDGHPTFIPPDITAMTRRSQKA